MTATATARHVASPVLAEGSFPIKRITVEFDDPAKTIAAPSGVTTGKVYLAIQNSRGLCSTNADPWVVVSIHCYGAESIPFDAKEQQEVDLFLDAAYVLSESGMTREGLDHIFQKMNSILVDGKLSLASRILKQVDAQRLSATLLVGFLSITLSTSALLAQAAGPHGPLRRPRSQ